MWGTGLTAAQNGHIWSIFVRLLYGLDFQLLKKKILKNGCVSEAMPEAVSGNAMKIPLNLQ